MQLFKGIAVAQVIAALYVAALLTMFWPSTSLLQTAQAPSAPAARISNMRLAMPMNCPCCHGKCHMRGMMMACCMPGVTICACRVRTTPSPAVAATGIPKLRMLPVSGTFKVTRMVNDLVAVLLSSTAVQQPNNPAVPPPRLCS